VSVRQTNSSRGGGAPGQAMASVSTLDDFLELENDPAFVQISCPSTGILAWPAIRQDVVRTLVGDRVFPTGSPAGVGPHHSVQQAISAVVGALVWNAARTPRPVDVLLVATGAGLVRADGLTRNRHVDYFAQVLGSRAWTLEGWFPGLRAMRTRVNRRVGSLIVDRATIALGTRVRPRRLQR
jgi:hypothetical protein